MSWRRALGSLVTLLVPGALLAAFFVHGIVAIALLAVAALCLAVSLSQRGDTIADRDWRDLADADVAARPRTPGGSVTRSLGWVESRELVLSPWFGAGAGFCVLFGFIAAVSFERSWWLSAALLPLLVHPLCGLTIVATHRSATRSRRDETDELFESCPATRAQRTGALLLTGIAPIAVATVFVVATMAGAAVKLDHIYGPLDGRVVSDAVIAALLLPAGATALGVLLGRRWTFALTPFLVLAVIALLNIEMADRGLDGRGWLTTGIASGQVDLVYYEPPWLGRLIWFVGLVALVAALATRTPGATRSRIAISAASLITVVGMIVAVRPLDDGTVTRLAAYAIDPAPHEACEPLADGMRVCALDPYADHAANVAAYLEPVASAIPPAAFATPMTLRPTVGEAIDQLPSQVRERLEPTPFPDDMIDIPYVHLDSGRDESRMLLAAAAVGLRLGPGSPENTLVDGQARGVVMLWLAAAGYDRATAVEHLDASGWDPSDDSERGNVWPGECRATVQWSPSDLVAARAVVALDRAEVASILERDWSHWTDPSTSTDDLMAALDLAPVGPSERIEPLGKLC
jgi:hypothetical protein